MKTIKNQTLDGERALYHTVDAAIVSCRFEGAADGESALKECRRIAVTDTLFALRYPLWHTNGFTLTRSEMRDTCRAALWYSTDGKITDCSLYGIKALRECRDVSLLHTEIVSPEFGWKCENVAFDDCRITSEYFMFMSRDITLKNVKMNGKYSFQYVENMTVDGSCLDTKDAFWHAKNVTVRHSAVKGEYLGWYSDGLTLIDCDIIGTQPLCYCKNLRLINCRMTDCDLAFEYSDVEADVTGQILSVKNPHSGKIAADAIGKIIKGDSVMENSCEIVIRQTV